MATIFRKYVLNWTSFGQIKKAMIITDLDEERLKLILNWNAEIKSSRIYEGRIKG